uniref:Innexin n=1 Tax=Macrostomum lignano TaxID=282301 RepID=A0A1I8JSG7_9PLAT
AELVDTQPGGHGDHVVQGGLRTAKGRLLSPAADQGGAGVLPERKSSESLALARSALDDRTQSANLEQQGHHRRQVIGAQCVQKLGCQVDHLVGFVAGVEPELALASGQVMQPLHNRRHRVEGHRQQAALLTTVQSRAFGSPRRCQLLLAGEQRAEVPVQAAVIFRLAVGAEPAPDARLAEPQQRRVASCRLPDRIALNCRLLRLLGSSRRFSLFVRATVGRLQALLERAGLLFDLADQLRHLRRLPLLLHFQFCRSTVFEFFEYIRTFGLLSSVGLLDLGDRVTFLLSAIVLLLVCSLVIGAKEYFTKSISCMLLPQMIESYCWVTGVYPLRMTEPLPDVSDEWLLKHPTIIQESKAEESKSRGRAKQRKQSRGGAKQSESKAEGEKADESKAEESKAEESKAEESKERGEQSRGEQSKAEESKAEESKAEKSKAEETRVPYQLLPVGCRCYFALQALLCYLPKALFDLICFSRSAYCLSFIAVSAREASLLSPARRAGESRRAGDLPGRPGWWASREYRARPGGSKWATRCTGCLPWCPISKRFGNYTFVMLPGNQTGGAWQSCCCKLELMRASLSYGAELMRNITMGLDWEITMVLPRLGACRFSFRPNHALISVTPYCTSASNIFHEKVYIILWFYFVLAAIVNSASILPLALEDF